MMSERNIAEHLRLVPAVLLATTILLNIAWPITQGNSRDVVTILGVLSFFAMSKIHAFKIRGFSYTLKFVVVVTILALVAEVIGTHSGIPFGDYSYSDRIGMKVFDVPLLIPLAWFMMMYPSLLFAQFATNRKWLQVTIASWLMATWDLYLDPQMVNEGYWTWFNNGVITTDIPLTNFFGWLVTSATIYTILLWRLPDDSVTVNFKTHDLVPFIAMMWVWLGSFLANIMPMAPFLNQPAVAVTGLIGMGIALVPILIRWRHHG